MSIPARLSHLNDWFADGILLQEKYLDEIDELEVWDFTHNLLGRVAYNALYTVAREEGLTTHEAAEFCTSKWIRHHEEYLLAVITGALLARGQARKAGYNGEQDFSAYLEISLPQLLRQRDGDACETGT